jgi:hypothetical protein
VSATIKAGGSGVGSRNPSGLGVSSLGGVVQHSRTGGGAGTGPGLIEAPGEAEWHNALGLITAARARSHGAWTMRVSSLGSCGCEKQLSNQEKSAEEDFLRNDHGSSGIRVKGPRRQRPVKMRLARVAARAVRVLELGKALEAPN